MTTTVEARHSAARAFVRSLNILLKFARMYDFGHPRTVKQYETAWSELRAALGSDSEAGLLLAVSGDQLLLDGTPLESAAAEKSFARMLSAAGIASIHFSPNVTTASLGRLVKGFPTSTGSKPVQLAEQLKMALQGDTNIHVNEVCFVPADSAVAKSTIAAQLAARTLTMNSEESDKLFNDPEKLLQLMVAAEGRGAGGGGSSNNGNRGSSGDNGFDGSGSGPGSGHGFGPGNGTAPEPGNGTNASAPADGSTALAQVDAQAAPPSGPAVPTVGPAGTVAPPSRWNVASTGIRGTRSARSGPGSMTVDSAPGRIAGHPPSVGPDRSHRRIEGKIRPVCLSNAAVHAAAPGALYREPSFFGPGRASSHGNVGQTGPSEAGGTHCGSLRDGKLRAWRCESECRSTDA